MDATPHHNMHDLFGQLGLPNTNEDIESFIAQHSPLDATLKLEEAPFWTPQQAKFLHDGIKQDSDWATKIDSLDASLRHTGPH